MNFEDRTNYVDFKIKIKCVWFKIWNIYITYLRTHLATQTQLLSLQQPQYLLLDFSGPFPLDP